MSHPMSQTRNPQAGVMLIEALVGILIFAIGILALIAMQATAIRAAQDSRYRTEAINYANDLLSQIMVSVNRNPANFEASLQSFVHQPTTGKDCEFSGAASATDAVKEWVKLVTNADSVAHPQRMPLPGTSAGMLQVRVDTALGAYNQVAITVCWRAPDDPVARKHVLISYVT
jgi:type IV pilus assembly protein PilV